MINTNKHIINKKKMKSKYIIKINNKTYEVKNNSQKTKIKHKQKMNYKNKQ